MDLKTVKVKAKEYMVQAYNWCKENPETALAIGGAVLAGGKYVVKRHDRHAYIRKQEELKTLNIYDRSHGHYWPLRRELTTREYMEIDRRKDSGEKLRDILDDMRVLK